MIKNFRYSFPTEIVFGVDSLVELSSLLQGQGVIKIMMLFGTKAIKINGVYQRIVGILQAADIEVVEFGGCLPNPDVKFINSASILAKKEQVQLILAVGGGSVIDASKAVALLMSNDATDGISPYMIGKKTFQNNALPIGVVLTAVGSGSEGNGSFVLSNYENKSKVALSNLSTRPVFAICDPKLTVTLSKFQTSCGCVDIICHLLEQYFCLEEGNHFSNDLIIGAIKNVIFHSKILYSDPLNLDARANIMLASSFALSYLLSLGKTLDWSMHRIEHIISGLHPNITHGAGLACIIPPWLRFASHQQIYKDKVSLLENELVQTYGQKYSGLKHHFLDQLFNELFIQLGLQTQLKLLISENINTDRISQLVQKDGKTGKVCQLSRIDIKSVLDDAL